MISFSLAMVGAVCIVVSTSLVAIPDEHGIWTWLLSIMLFFIGFSFIHMGVSWYGIV